MRARVGIRRTARTRRALTLAGRVNPGAARGPGDAAAAHALRRLAAASARKALRAASTDASSYRFRVRRLRRAAVYRVKVAANDGGAHLGATSRALLVGKKQRKRR